MNPTVVVKPDRAEIVDFFGSSVFDTATICNTTDPDHFRYVLGRALFVKRTKEGSTEDVLSPLMARLLENEPIRKAIEQEVERGFSVAYDRDVECLQDARLLEEIGKK